MTIREINRTISTANYATYTISELGGGNIRYKELHYSEIPARKLKFLGGLLPFGMLLPDEMPITQGNCFNSVLIIVEREEITK